MESPLDTATRIARTIASEIGARPCLSAWFDRSQPMIAFSVALGRITAPVRTGSVW